MDDLRKKNAGTNENTMVPFCEKGEHHEDASTKQQVRSVLFEGLEVKEKSQKCHE
jgi:hypothetical protein